MRQHREQNQAKPEPTDSNQGIYTIGHYTRLYDWRCLCTSN